VNVVGYLQHSTSLGEVGRRLVDCLDAAGVGIATVATHRTGSPPLDPMPAVDAALRYDTNLIAVNAEQFPVLQADMGPVLLPGRRNVVYWFWELDTPSADAAAALAHRGDWQIDEVWAASHFVADAFRTATDRPVHVVPVPVEVPHASPRDRASFRLPADRAVFLCTFDFLSVVERKNPFAVIDAFRDAFRPGEGPLLVVKTTNGHQRWSGLERLRVAVEGRDDIRVWDEHLTQADQMALIREVDCLVSLHRSEGLGLHLAEAMGMGTPVLATAYSGNVDFMDATCAAMVGYELVPVEHGEGVYPAGAHWAEPDRDDAVRWLRRLASDEELRDKLGRAGRERIASLPGAAATGELMRSLLGAGAR
jgi:glycosyltransferase involved in cell wall biosynthesis